MHLSGVSLPSAGPDSRYATALVRPLVAARECENCGTSFEGRRDAKYCGGVCRANAAKARRESRSKAQPRRSTALTSAVTRALRSSETSRADGAIKALAKIYARQIDADPGAIKDLGPQLRLVLVELHMTPKSRVTSTPPAARGGVVGGGDGDDWLEELRRERDARPDRAAAVDPSTS